METTIIELKEILLNLKEEIKEIRQDIGKLKIEMSLLQKGKKKNKKIEKLEIIKSNIIGTNLKKPTQKPQKGSYDYWFMETQYPKILEEAEELKAEIRKKEKGKEKLEIKEQTESNSE